MRRFCDSAGVPGAANIANAHKDGVTAWAGYLSSPYAYRSWSAADLSRVLRQAGALLPVYVAPYPPTKLVSSNAKADADRALHGLAAILDIAPGPKVIALDIEAPVWAHNPAGVLHYFATFVAEVGAHAQVVPYSSPSCLIGLGQHNKIPAVWAASWLSRPGWPRANTPPGLGTAWAGHRAWQVHGQTKAYGGMAVDLNVVDDTVPLLHHITAHPIITPTPKPAAPTPAPPAHTAEATLVVDGRTYRGRLTA